MDNYERPQDCGKDKGRPKGWLYDWESMATMEMQNLETRLVESSLVVYVPFVCVCVCVCVCVSLLSLIDTKRQSLCQ